MTPRNPWRRTRRRELTTIAALSVSILVTFSILCAWIAHAAPETPQQDGKFLFSLGEAGFGYESATQVIIAGHLVCDLMDHGGTVNDVVGELLRNTPLDRAYALKFTAISIANYCGRHGDALRPHKGGSGAQRLGVIA